MHTPTGHPSLPAQKRAEASLNSDKQPDTGDTMFDFLLDLLSEGRKILDRF